MKSRLRISQKLLRTALAKVFITNPKKRCNFESMVETWNLTAERKYPRFAMAVKHNSVSVFVLKPF